MEFLTHLPTDSVLRRHAETERNRELGLPPTDSVLRRHYAHLLASLQSMAAPAVVAPSVVAKAVAAPAAAPRATATMPAQAPARSPAPAAASGGLIGWFRRLLGM